MNNEFDAKNEGHPNLDTPQKKSRPLLWVGGCGCLIIILVCGGGIFGLIYWSMSFAETFNNAQAMARESQAVQDALGEDLTFGETPAQSQDPDNPGLITFSFPVSGSKGEGELLITVEFFQNETKSIVVQLEDGTEIDVMASEEFNLDIDEPDISEE